VVLSMVVESDGDNRIRHMPENSVWLLIEKVHNERRAALSKIQYSYCIFFLYSAALHY
jgi:hypothetical protein